MKQFLDLPWELALDRISEAKKIAKDNEDYGYTFRGVKESELFASILFRAVCKMTYHYTDEEIKLILHRTYDHVWKWCPNYAVLLDDTENFPPDNIACDFWGLELDERDMNNLSRIISI